MEKLAQNTQKIIDFIYDKPELVVPLLNQNGYSIDMATATLQGIYQLTFQALSVDENQKFAKELEELIANEGYANIIPIAVAAGASIVSSVIGGIFGSDAARKQRKLMWDMKMAELSSNEKISYEEIRTKAETERLNILANSLLLYRQSLQKESSVRLKDTWIYVVGLGVGIGILYGLYLVTSKK